MTRARRQCGANHWETIKRSLGVAVGRRQAGDLKACAAVSVVYTDNTGGGGQDAYRRIELYGKRGTDPPLAYAAAVALYRRNTAES